MAVVVNEVNSRVYDFSITVTKINESTDVSLERAAEELRGSYQTDQDLNAFSSLNADDWQDSAALIIILQL